MLIHCRPSVRCRPLSTFHIEYYFLKNGQITFFLFWCTASFGRYPCTVKIWIWLNNSKGHFKRSERSNLAPFFYLEAIFSKTV